MLIIREDNQKEMELMQELIKRGYNVSLRENLNHADVFEDTIDILSSEYPYFTDECRKAEIALAVVERVKGVIGYGGLYLEATTQLHEIIDQVMDEAVRINGWSQYTPIEGELQPILTIGCNDIYYLNGFYKVVVEELTLCDKTVLNGPCFATLEEAMAFVNEITETTTRSESIERGNTSIEIPSIDMIRKEYNELVDLVGNVTTLKQVKELVKSKKLIVEVNGGPLEEIASDMEDTSVEWFRYEYYKHLSFIYCYIKDGKVTDILFDVYAKNMDECMIDSCSIDKLSEEVYKEAVEYVQQYASECFEDVVFVNTSRASD